MQVACHHPIAVPLASSAPAPLLHAPDLILQPSSSTFKFVAYGDIRFTDSELPHVSNRAVRTAIIDAVVKTKPAFVVITGDVPWRGAENGDWAVFDHEIKPVRDARISMLPAIGNHEYYNRFLRQNREVGVANFYTRFDQIPRRPAAPWYSARYANCYFLFLDTTDDDSPGSAQLEWLKGQLESVPSDVDYLFVVAHRGPFTSATDSLHKPRLAEQEIARLLESHQAASPKTRILMVSGHVHNYEHFRHGGVEYIVTGGGGAQPHPLHRSDNDLFKPKVPDENEYHYCLISIDHEKLRLEMYRLDDVADSKAQFSVSDSFDLPLPPSH